MLTIKENDLLRLSMILENQGETTRNKYICKFSEFVLFDSNKDELSVVEICEEILNRFQLQFDITEIEKAIESKGKNRITLNEKKYKLTPKVANQLSSLNSAEDKLKEYVEIFMKEQQIDSTIDILGLIKKYLYYSFNSNAKNFSSIIGAKPMTIADDNIISEFKPTSLEVDLINRFISWDKPEKNKLFYSIVSSCYEYCLITTKKNPFLSKSIFKGKVFFLDTNIIFRMAGINKDERRFVVNSFIKKCKEVGITLCYTSAVFDELSRVIDRQIEYIQRITNRQVPVNPEKLNMLNDNYGINDFYNLYYNWCKEPQNKYYDFSSFKAHLKKRIYTELNKLEYMDSSKTKANDKSRFAELTNNLKEYKNNKRRYRTTTDESIETDIKQILFLDSLRPQNARNLWEMNEYLVSADQLFVSWAEKAFDGIPLVVIPSLWLSIILRTCGRSSNDDYKSFCMFLTLRHHHSEEDDLNINPIELLSRLSEKTISSQLKEQIIDEIVSNRNNYTFKSEENYDTGIECAFDKILSENKELHKEELKKVVKAEKENLCKVKKKYEQESKRKKTANEYAKEISMKKATKKTEWYARKGYIPLIVNALPFILVIVTILSFKFKVQWVNLLLGIVTSEKIDEKIISILIWIFNLFIVSLPLYFAKIWKYLSSDRRRNTLCSKYFKQQLKLLHDN